MLTNCERKNCAPVDRQAVARYIIAVMNMNMRMRAHSVIYQASEQITIEKCMVKPF
jgi:hypothetical protein